MRKLLAFGLLIILIFLLTVTQVQAQKGRGESRSRSHSRSNSSSFSKKSKSKDLTKQSSWLLWGIGGAFVIASIYGLFEMKKTPDERKKKIEKIMQDYQTKLLQFPSVLTEQQKQSIINSLVKNKYTVSTISNISINAHDDQEFTCETEILEIQRQTNSKYKVILSGKDQVGDSTMIGLIIFKGEGFGLKFSKEYQVKEKAGKIARVDILLYQGESQDDFIQGQWAFYGHESSQQCSGTWKMTKL